MKKASMIIHPEELSKKWIDRIYDAGIPTIGIHPVGGPKAAESLAELVELCKTVKYRNLIDYALGRGLQIEYEIHSAGYLMPKDLFDTHPDYFRMNAEGERTNDYNFCVSNPDALSLFATRARELAGSLYSSSHDFYFWMDDGHALQCHCPKCKNISTSDQQLIALNAMLSEIKKTFPDARMAYLAYMDSIVVPKKVKPIEGIFLEYAPFEKYTAKGEDAPQLIEREKQMVKPLMDFFCGEYKVLEYWYDNSLYSNWTKPAVKFEVNKEKMKSEIEEYKKMGFSNIATFACYLGEDYEALHGDVDIIPFCEAVK